MSGSGGYSYPSGIWRRSLIGLPFSFSGWLRALHGEINLLHGRHDQLKNISEKHPVLLYYRAYSLFLRGDFEKACSYASRFCAYAPRHREGKYLLSDILNAKQEKNQAFNTLCTNTLLSRRKTWIKLANLVDSHQDFLQFKKIYDTALAQHIIDKDDNEILENYAMGAQRGNDYEEAIIAWEKISSKHIRKKPTLTSELAANALRTLISSTEKAGLQIFLISGTLLGLMRTGDFLSHDSDLDTGIFDGFDSQKLKNAIYNSGCFTIMAQRSPHCLRIRHVNGTPIDIFTHYREKTDFWHGGVKVSWHNSPFRLKSTIFKGITVWIPDPPEKYLEENYGKDWHIPVSHFDSAFDCPNSRIENDNELYIHRLKIHLNKNYGG